MGVKWTEEQEKVIRLRNRNILVSAAAGSGKTAVLVERIITMFFSSTAVTKSLLRLPRRFLTLSSAFVSFSCFVSIIKITRLTSVSICNFLARL